VNLKYGEKMDSKTKEKFYDYLNRQVTFAREAKANKDVAEQAMRCLDLTYLGDEKDPQKILELCAKARSVPSHHTAAVCVYPEFIGMAARELSDTDIKIATVINFPFGNVTNDGQPATPENTEDAIRGAIKDGAHEIDIVFDYQGYHDMEEDLGRSLLLACREACGVDAVMKVILETSSFHFEHDIVDAGHVAIECGADMLKTSTGKHGSGGATLKAAAAMIYAVKNGEKTGRDVGIKISGGVKDVKDCAEYMSLTRSVLGDDFVTPALFRLGASSVYDSLVAVIKDIRPMVTNPCLDRPVVR